MNQWNFQWKDFSLRYIQKEHQSKYRKEEIFCEERDLLEKSNDATQSNGNEFKESY